MRKMLRRDDVEEMTAACSAPDELGLVAVIRGMMCKKGWKQWHRSSDHKTSGTKAVTQEQ